MGVFLFVRWLHSLLLTLLGLVAVFDLYGCVRPRGWWAPRSSPLGIVVSAVYFVLVERLLPGGSARCNRNSELHL